MGLPYGLSVACSRQLDAERDTWRGMSRENVEIVRRGFEAWEAGDLSGMLAVLADDFVMRRHAPMPDPGIWPGREGLLNLAVEWGEAFEEWTMKGDEFIDAGDHVVVRVLHEGHGADSGAPVTGVYWYLVRMRDGKAIAIDICPTREFALEAVGLSE
jgi:ketosteroid isomerase-like protein